jgi:hypothetical protein
MALFVSPLRTKNYLQNYRNRERPPNSITPCSAANASYTNQTLLPQVRMAGDEGEMSTKTPVSAWRSSSYEQREDGVSP